MLWTTTTLIGKDGRVVSVKICIEDMETIFPLPKIKQIATIKNYDHGTKIVVSKLINESPNT